LEDAETDFEHAIDTGTPTIYVIYKDKDYVIENSITENIIYKYKYLYKYSNT
jgi:hypothetical protein